MANAPGHGNPPGNGPRAGHAQHGHHATPAYRRESSFGSWLTVYALAFGHRCRQPDVRPSHGTVGDACDNAMAGSCFAGLECERLDTRTSRTQAEAKLDVLQYIERWYTPHRRHSALGNQSPRAYARLNAETA